MRSLRLASLMLGLVLFNQQVDAGMNLEVAAGINGSRSSRLVLLSVAREAGTLMGLPSYQTLDLGGWDGRYDAAVAGVAQGLRLPAGRTLVEFSLGGGYVSQTSDRLATAFEFYEQLTLRREIIGIDMAVSYRHWSNAGLRQPNRGMDFVGFVVTRRW